MFQECEKGREVNAKKRLPDASMPKFDEKMKAVDAGTIGYSFIYWFYSTVKLWRYSRTDSIIDPWLNKKCLLVQPLLSRWMHIIFLLELSVRLRNFTAGDSRPSISSRKWVARRVSVISQGVDNETPPSDVVFTFKVLMQFSHYFSFNLII